ncbi:hypothetical protein J5N97_001262 [Dioscorea zingiberensis]|uniref:Uncharacterized protein n=1 Tax=Dioscorea zingiberensis TaxID=325984 RepID=A0A9D5H2K5_9LILI|nr:hypothetical protein J5N97_001262 [Dioscorea zingiberensis]
MPTTSSTNFLAILNLLTFALSIPILSTGIYLAAHAITECEKFLQTPLIAIGILLMLTSLVGFVGASSKNVFLLWSGCCKPPTECGFIYRNPTVWDKPAGFSTSNSDCNAWQNDASILCYECQSCKAGVTENLKADLKRLPSLTSSFLPCSSLSTHNRLPCLQ